eukprot:TRINITY_DN27627_c0_g3_i4.p1 TRINITY_DN27627_c0_g3~~TRINITY_DN27627_c0_g3_i4.p1  ORF type:complete len:113 (-),score=17.20 TRINITY_DN27627_c0_g3_i4:14-352(-)
MWGHADKYELLASVERRRSAGAFSGFAAGGSNYTDRLPKCDVLPKGKELSQSAIVMHGVIWAVVALLAAWLCAKSLGYALHKAGHWAETRSDLRTTKELQGQDHAKPLGQAS